MLGSRQDAEDLVQETMLRWTCSILSEIAAVRRVDRAATALRRCTAGRVTNPPHARSESHPIASPGPSRDGNHEGDTGRDRCHRPPPRQPPYRPGAGSSTPRALVEIVGGPPYRGSPFINAAAEYADPDHPVRRLISRHRRAFRDLLVALPAVSAR